MKGRKIFWGIFFILATILLIASQVGSFMEIGFWSLLGTIILVAIIIQSAIYRVWFGICISVALLYLIYYTPLGWPYIAPWILIVAAILLSIGLHLLFKPKEPKYKYSNHNHCHGENGEYSNGGYRPNSEISDNEDDNNPDVSVKFGNMVRYLHSDALVGGRLSCSFGSLEVYFDEATVAPGGAEIYLHCNFGSIKLYIPRSWDVQDRTNSSVGGVSFTGQSRLMENAPILVLTGSVSMGGIEIAYV